MESHLLLLPNPLCAERNVSFPLLVSMSLTQEKNTMACLQSSILHRQQEPLRGERQRRKTEERRVDGDKPAEEGEQSGLCHKIYSGLTPVSITTLPGSDTACFPA